VERVDLDGRVALVTGAGRNIGREIALTLARRGCDVVVNVGSRRDEAEAVAAEIRSLGRRGVVAVANVTRSAEVDAMVATAERELGRLDVLVNNAAIRPPSTLVAMTDELWNDVIAVNLTGPFYCSRAAARLMIRQRSGCIVNISGVTAVLGGAHDTHIAASKAGLHGLTKALAVELGEHGIRVNTLMLSTIDSGRAPRVQWSAERTPLRRRGTLVEVANACAFLASDDAGFITGQAVGVTGGTVLL
jgi:3-oxoacyl-[acyl-carrier protein] reductase